MGRERVGLWAAGRCTASGLASRAEPVILAGRHCPPAQGGCHAPQAYMKLQMQQSLRAPEGGQALLGKSAVAVLSLQPAGFINNYCQLAAITVARLLW